MLMVRIERSNALRTFGTVGSIDLFARWGWELLYSDSSLCNDDLVPKLKEPLLGIHHRIVKQILTAVDRSNRFINRTGTASGILLIPNSCK
ncbi:hypothetical protein AVEN_132708-1 [Araneus ventricosus]|uniref:Uncharacterized protein n=1 Tax=Araneus ventricosus TaxID=182803 RepID=A0A4Y2AYA7_ARAVE|nr:hypothetical protein AVEN_132708-1 [Araneus ventricosus]